jgi:flagellar hook protein FlgE
MGSSLFAGISGLASSGKQLDVIANNIANVNTVGFRSGKIHFGDILSQSVTGGSAAGMQVGRGVEVVGITTQFSPGSFETTANATDLAIDGDGFFIVQDADGGEYYTRAGAFSLDNEGYLVDVNSFKVQGKNIVSGVVSSSISDISLSGVQSNPAASTYVRIGANLDSTTTTGDTFNASQTAYDSLGDIHSLKTTFQKTEGNGVWGVEAYLDDVAATAQSKYGVKFDTDGVLEKIYTGTVGTVTTPNNLSNGAVTTATIVDACPETVNGDFTLTRAAGVWGITEQADYLLAVIVAKSDTQITLDLGGGAANDVTLDLSGTWYDADTIVITTVDGAPDSATTVVTHTTMDGDATAVVDRPGQVPHTGTLLLTRGADATTWTITDPGGYAQPAVISADASTVEISLSGTSSTKADVTLTLSGTWAEGNTLTVPLDGCEAGTGLVTDANGITTADLNNPEKFVSGNGNDLILTRTAGVWGVTDDGDYTGAAVLSSSDTEITLSLDGGTDTDVTLTLSGTYIDTNTLAFDLEAGIGTTSLADIDLTMPPVAGATIGTSGVVSWDMYGTTSEAITGYASTSVVKTLVHDGYSSGSLKSISVTQDGTISGFFTNGQTSDIARIMLAGFPNTGGLKRMGKNLFATTVESGDAVRNDPGAAGMGDISPNSLEMSNTDIATEFINMITAQRAYQASAKIVTVTDQMMAELMNIKR